MIKKIRILFTLFFFGVFISLSSQSVRVSGIICDANKIPLSNVTIKQKTKNKSISSTISDNIGQYNLQIYNTIDSIHLEYTSIGFETLHLVLPRLKDNLKLNVILRDIDKILDSVTIIAHPPRTMNMRMDIFDVKDRAYLLDSNIESLITTLPGVSSTNELSSQYKVRGGNFDENIIYVNGIEIYRPLLVGTAQQEGLSFINPSLVQSIAFSTGGYNAEYGDIMSSVLDISYKRPDRFEGTMGGSLMDGSLYIGHSTKRFSQITSVRYKSTEALLSTTDTKAEYKPTFMDIQSFMTFDVTPRWEVSFLGNYSRNIYQFTPQTRSTNFGALSQIKNMKVYFDGWEKDKFITSQAALSLKGKLGDNVQLGFSGSYFVSNEQERYDIGGRYRLTEVIDIENTDEQSNPLLGVGAYHEHARNKLLADVYDIGHQGQWKLDNHQIKWGLSLRHEKFKDKIKEWKMRDSTGYLLPNLDSSIEMYSNLMSNNVTNTTRFSGYLQDKYVFDTSVGLFTFTAGIRASYWDFNADLIISPRAALYYIPARNQNFVFHLSGGVYHQAPFYKEYQRIVQDTNGNNIIQANKDIKSQQSRHLVLGGDYYFKTSTGAFKFTTELYYKGLSDIIPYTINNVKIRYSGLNEGKGYITGIDFGLFGELVPNTTSWISLSLMKTQQEIDKITTPLPTDQRYNLSIYLQDYMPGYERLKVSLKGVFSDGLPFTSPGKTFNDKYFRTSAYKRVDLGISWEVLGEKYAIKNTYPFCGAFKNAWIGLDVFNLFDISNVNTHYWVTDVHSKQYAVPNYLTGRQFNVRFLVDF